jgi:hypothetical protein
MARKGTGTSRAARRRKRSTNQSSKHVSKRAKRSNRSASQHGERLRTFDAANLFRKGEAKTVSDAARLAGTNLKAMWRWIPGAIEKDRSTGRLRVKATDRYSERVEIVTDSGALVVTARGSRQRQLAGQHRATYRAVFDREKPPSNLFAARKLVDMNC